MIREAKVVWHGTGRTGSGSLRVVLADMAGDHQPILRRYHLQVSDHDIDLHRFEDAKSFFSQRLGQRQACQYLILGHEDLSLQQGSHSRVTSQRRLTREPALHRAM